MNNKALRVSIYTSVASGVSVQEVPIVVEAGFLLFTLNEYLSRTALLVQPLHFPDREPDDCNLDFVDIPLPLPAGEDPRIGGIHLRRWVHLCLALLMATAQWPWCVKDSDQGRQRSWQMPSGQR